jgi:hypothetical protein
LLLPFILNGTGSPLPDCSFGLAPAAIFKRQLASEAARSGQPEPLVRVTPAWLLCQAAGSAEPTKPGWGGRD